MRAVVMERTGPPEVLTPTTRPDPTPGPGEVLIEVEAAATTFIDTQMRAGTGPRPLSPDDLPIVLGNGVAGRVVASGDDRGAALVGTDVVATTGGRGGYASLSVVAVDDTYEVPDGLDLRSAVALLADGRTALGLAEVAAIRPRETVVVTAAGGGVGSLLVQLARRAGARVVALAGGDAKLVHAASLGAECGIDYTDPRWVERLDAAAPDGIDVAFDGVGGTVGEALFQRVRRGGRHVVHGMASGTWARIDRESAGDRGVEVVGLDRVGATRNELRRLVERALELGANGELRPTIGQARPLEEAAEAHAAMEARRVIGKTILLP